MTSNVIPDRKAGQELPWQKDQPLLVGDPAIGETA